VPTRYMDDGLISALWVVAGQAVEENESERLKGEQSSQPLPVYDIGTDAELAETVRELTGFVIPARRICPNHRAPLEAFADAFFARSSMAIWKGSRGLAGKTTLLALLAHIEAILLGANVTILGGSGQQSARVHEAQDKFWAYQNAPIDLLKKDRTTYETELISGSKTIALLASTRSARGPHPHRLRMDEVDEIRQGIIDAAMGQTMASGGIRAQTVMSSTHQYPDGSMSTMLKRASDKGWPTYEWCYRECLQSNGGWLEDSEVDRKRGEVTAVMWDTEYELQEPSSESRAIQTTAVETMFRRDLGQYAGRLREYIEIEPPVRGATYANGADWAKTTDYTVVWTLRTDVKPMRFVAYQRDGRRPWPQMVKLLDDRNERYPGKSAHDATGLGGVVSDMLESAVEDKVMVGRGRSDMINEYIAAVENEEIEAPYIEHAYGEHKYCTQKDLWNREGHPPDSFMAAAVTYWAHKHGKRKRRWGAV